MLTHGYSLNTEELHRTMFHKENVSTGEPPLQPSIVWRHPLLAIILFTICLLTVSGNCLVVIAVCTKKYLRNPTGLTNYI